ncbi:phosphatidylinositol 4-phosphate 5-kinase 9-like [Aristolochia californica]|uniref:phosphatidylinositol 4-phosphate 5-kinase 9-like n=1 Tax=Aristolochia californica TaxID=171875 RepID=UPI0035E21E63
MATWDPPPYDCIKLNFDGSPLGCPRPAGVGGVFKDSSGDPILFYAGPVGIADSNTTEVLLRMLPKQIAIDSKFLESQCIMDYSLLLGVHYRAPLHVQSFVSNRQSVNADDLTVHAEESQEDESLNYPQGLVLIPRGSNGNSVIVGPHIRGRRLRASAAGDEETPDPARREHTSLGGAYSSQRRPPTVHRVYDVVLYLGIIDILQDYNISKKIEHAYKSLQLDSLAISAVDPILYSQRFLQYIQKVFPEIH